jgi:uncharacterized membrane protein
VRIVTSSSSDRDQQAVPPDAERPDRAGGDAAERGETTQHALHALAAVREQLVALEQTLCAGRHPISGPAARLTHSTPQDIARFREATQHVHLPAWLRRTEGERRWPVAVAILVAIALQVALPDQLVLQSRWLLPSLELTLVIALLVASPKRFDRESRKQRAASLTLTGLISLANAWSAVLLVLGLLHGREGQDAAPLLASGVAIWLTNIIAFGLWYWQFDRGGPAARANARKLIPDFQFVQMQSPELAPPDWEPEFVDYLYLSFTNATAFSPTDVMPLSRWAKLTMLAQSLVSLVTVALIIARAVNILK